ncbi:MAG: hypothetical protein LBR19_04155 [Bifidobacteriaceae bacterium]|jgi:mRNA-degrading endonuclease YafQ of YafQ-DinJ toxin-antitoxin module|nr:hypothetical protein [Bifidobacteriaceae bacterium]
MAEAVPVIARFEATKQFSKSLRHLTAKQQQKVKATLQTALDDLNAPLLRVHALAGAWAGAFSIAAGGDLRIVFDVVAETSQDGSTVAVGVLIMAGTHSQIYG